MEEGGAHEIDLHGEMSIRIASAKVMLQFHASVHISFCFPSNRLPTVGTSRSSSYNIHCLPSIQRS